MILLAAVHGAHFIFETFPKNSQISSDKKYKTELKREKWEKRNHHFIATFRIHRQKCHFHKT